MNFVRSRIWIKLGFTQLSRSHYTYNSFSQLSQGLKRRQPYLPPLTKTILGCCLFAHSACISNPILRVITVNSLAWISSSEARWGEAWESRYGGKYEILQPVCSVSGQDREPIQQLRSNGSSYSSELKWKNALIQCITVREEAVKSVIGYSLLSSLVQYSTISRSIQLVALHSGKWTFSEK